MKEKIALLLSVIQTLILIAILVILLSDKGRNRGRTPGRGQPEPLTKIAKPLKINDTDAIWGSKDAPGTIIAYIDYQCPFCMDVYKNLKEIEKGYISTGKVKVVFRDFPLKMHAYAEKLAIDVECARQQGKFWEMADLILTAKDKSDETQIDGRIETLKLNKNTFTACVADSLTLGKIEKDIEEARSYTVRGTPALFINNIFSRGTLSADDIINILGGKMQVKAARSGSCN